jgi:hypothetical protein
MSDPNVIQDTSLTLKSLLEARLNSNLGPGDHQVTVTVDSPHRGNQEEFRVNLFLYSVLHDEGRRNTGGWIPTERIDSKQRFAAEPLALRLYYLVTAFASDGLTEHHLLGEVMQEFYVNRRVPEAKLKGTLKTSRIRADHVEINLLNLDIDTFQKIWGSQNEPPRTSVAYELTAVFLDAAEADAEVQIVGKDKLGRLVAPIDAIPIDVIPFPVPATVTPDAARPGDVVRVHGSGLLVPQPTTGHNLVRIWFGGTEAAVLADNASRGALSVRVPATLKPGSAPITLQLDRYVSRSLPFDVLGPA